MGDEIKTKKQAIKILKKIRDTWFDGYYPLKHCMYDDKVTVEQKYNECIKILDPNED